MEGIKEKEKKKLHNQRLETARDTITRQFNCRKETLPLIVMGMHQRSNVVH